VTSVDFHPAAGAINFSHLLLSCSTDWTCKLWNPKNSKKPMFSFQDTDDYIYDAKWCPTHPSMFASVDGTGTVGLWDINEDTESPVLKTKVSQKALNRMKWSTDGKKILTGDSVGYLYLYDTREVNNIYLQFL
jgi:dynein intermediate chain